MVRFMRYATCFLLVSLTGCFVSRSEHQKLLVINVLDHAAYDDCRIPGSIQVDFDKVESYVQRMPKDTHIILYCSNYLCSASHFAAEKLIDKGYTNVQVYAGGMAEWFTTGLPVEGKAQAAYLRNPVPVPDEADFHVPVISQQDLAALLKIV